MADSSLVSGGLVSIVGAGPGDPGLITVKGLECLRRADVVVYDYLVNPKLLCEMRSDCESIYVGKKEGEHTLPQEEINALLVRKCQEGLRVVRLKGGDPFVFGRGGEEALTLRESGCAFEVVPGVTAGIAACAYAGIPVTHRGLTSTLAFVTGHEDPGKPDSDIDWKSMAGIGTIVFYMGVRNVGSIAANLTANGREPRTPVALIRWGTYSTQQTLVGTLEDIAQKVDAAQFGPPAIIVVGEVVGLRENMNWFESRPLFAKRIVVTRSRNQASDLSSRLEDLGAQVIEFPVIRIAAPDDPEPLREAARRVSQYDWIIFASANGVDSFFGALHEIGLGSRALSIARVCAIGPATSEHLRQNGIVPDLIPARFVAESVVDALASMGEISGKRILIPRADIAREYLVEALRQKGAAVHEVMAYRTLREEPEGIDKLREDLANGSIDAVTFTSSSTVRNFVEIVGMEVFKTIAANTLLVSIGPETSKAISEIRSAQIIQAEQYDIPGLVNALLAAFRSGEGAEAR